MKRALILIGAGLLVGAALRWVTSPLAPIANPHSPEAWEPR